MNSIKIWLLIGCSMITPLIHAQKFAGESEPIHILNSPFGEEFIAIHPSGSEMAFARLNHPYNQGGAKDAGDIWTTRLNAEWDIPRNWHELNTDNFSAPIGYSSDGSTFIYSKVSTKGGELTTEIWAYSKGQLEKLNVAYFKNKSVHQSGCLSKDNRYIVISMESGATEGVEDLYVIARDGDKWKAPKNLGKQVNTKFQEITPYLSSDNKTLFFATNGRKGEGSFDIYITRRLDDSWRNWSEPENLGSSVNTSGRETSFSYLEGNEYAYFVTTQNSDGYGDIQRIKIQSDTIGSTINIDTAQIVKTKVVVPISGVRLVNAKNSEPITTMAKFTSKMKMVSYTPDEQGIISVDKIDDCEIEVNGFLPVIQGAFSDSLVTIRMEPLEIGRTIRLEHVLFGRGTANILSVSFEELDRVVDMLKNNPDINILLKGHTDNKGDMAKNKKLSEERVLTVRKYLVGKGISKKRINGIGLGGEEPIASNETEETRKLNRRVEFEIVE